MHRRQEMSSQVLARIGIIGAGFARTTQIPAFRACKGARVVALACAHLEHAEEVAREFEIEHPTGDWRELVGRDDVDMVSIAAPPPLHMEMALAALEHHKAVLCEKPMAMNAREAQRMTERGCEVGVLALIDHELRFQPARLKLREMLRRGDVGHVRHVGLTFRSDSRADTGREWDWWADKAQGGGILGAIASHVIDSFQWLLGAGVSEVCCNLATHVLERQHKSTGKAREVTSDDEANLLLRFGDSELTQRATGNVSLSMVEAGRPEHRLEIFGSRAALLLEGNGELWYARIGEGKWERIEAERGDLAEGMRDNEWARSFTAFSRRIVEALQEGRATVKGAATFEDGYKTQLVLDAARRSDESGCWAVVQEAGAGTRGRRQEQEAGNGSNGTYPYGLRS